METLKIELLKVALKENHAIVTLNRGRANPMNKAMIVELRELFQSLKEDDTVQGVILTGKENYFSAGLDVIELYDFDQEQLNNFWENFLALIQELASFPKPLIAAISGHSHAGGCVLALCCDYRVMAIGDYQIGLNEIPVGITPPGIIFDLYSFWIGKRRAYQFLMQGRLLSPEEASEVRLVDEICPFSDVVGKAENQLKQYLSFDQGSWQKSKLNFRKGLIESLEIDIEKDLKATFEEWWSPESRKRMGMIVERLKN